MKAKGHTDERRPLEEVVECARRGDREAFGTLVVRFQDMAVGTAFAWLREIELAREAAQEAFADAYRLLEQLDDPAAFPGWFRRIVQKHCDRVTRRGRLAPIPAEERPEPDDPESALLRQEESERLRRCVEALPERERVLVALHYLAGEPQPEIAAFLELPLSTVKKRLRDARARLKKTRSEPMDPSATNLRPSQNQAFSDTVCFYVALRAGDTTEVGRLLERRPDLLETEQSWEVDLVRQGVLPFATRATPLITAVERGDRAMVSLLLDRGAAPDGACGCMAAESALWAATLLDRADLADLLLDAGADPNRAARAGNTPLHLAAMRGYDDLAHLLVRFGADPHRRDNEGRRPADWASAKGFMQLAVVLGGEAPGRSVAGHVASPAGSALLETGVKAVDLLVPIRRGSLVRVPFRAGVGMVVLLTEICQRFAVGTDREALWTGFAQGPFDPTDLRTELAESGLADQVGVFVAPRSTSPHARRAEFENGMRSAEAGAAAGRDVFVVVLAEEGFEADIDASLARLSRTPGGRITTACITPHHEGKRDAWTSLLPPFEAQVVLEWKRASRALYPALDPALCLSTALEGVVSARHRKLASEANDLLCAYATWDPEFDRPDPETFPSEHVEAACRAQRLLVYLTQPFLTTEPFHGRIAKEVPLTQTLDDVEAILCGREVPSADTELLRVAGPRQQRME